MADEAGRIHCFGASNPSTDRITLRPSALNVADILTFILLSNIKSVVTLELEITFERGVSTFRCLNLSDGFIPSCRVVSWRPKADRRPAWPPGLIALCLFQLLGLSIRYPNDYFTSIQMNVPLLMTSSVYHWLCYRPSPFRSFISQILQA